MGLALAQHSGVPVERRERATADQEHREGERAHHDVGPRGGLGCGSTADQAHRRQAKGERQQVGGPAEQEIQQVSQVGAAAANAVMDAVPEPG